MRNIKAIRLWLALSGVCSYLCKFRKISPISAAFTTYVIGSVAVLVTILFSCGRHFNALQMIYLSCFIILSMFYGPIGMYIAAKKRRERKGVSKGVRVKGSVKGVKGSVL